MARTAYLPPDFIRYLDEIRDVTAVLRRTDGFDIENMRVIDGNGGNVFIPQELLRDLNKTIVVVSSDFVVLPHLTPKGAEADRYADKLKDGLLRAGVIREDGEVAK